MSVRAFGKVVSGYERAGWSVPAECPVACGAGGEELDGGVGDDADAVVSAAVQHHLGEYGQVGRSGEQSRVARHAAERVGIFVIDLAALPAASAGGPRRCDAGVERVRRPELRLVHAERVEDVIGE